MGHFRGEEERKGRGGCGNYINACVVIWFDSMTRVGMLVIMVPIMKRDSSFELLGSLGPAGLDGQRRFVVVSVRTGPSLRRACCQPFFVWPWTE